MSADTSRGAKKTAPLLKVSDVMERDLTSVADDTSLLNAMELLTAHRTSGLPVVDDDGCVVGFISEKDILKAMIPGYIGYMDENFAMPSTAKIKERVKSVGPSPVSESMTKTPILFDEDEDISSAMVAIFKKNIHRAPVVKNGALVGTLSRENVLRGFIRANFSDSEERKE